MGEDESEWIGREEVQIKGRDKQTGSQRGWEKNFKREIDRGKKGETGKTEWKSLLGSTLYGCYPLLVQHRERLSTHYSSDLGGQLEESSINQTDAQAEADDSRQQCSQQPPPAHTHTLTHLQTSSHTSTSLHIYLHSSSDYFIYILSLFVACSLFLVSFFLIIQAVDPLWIWITSYKQ